MDVKNRRILDSASLAIADGWTRPCPRNILTPIGTNTCFLTLLAQFPRLTSGKLDTAKVSHSVTHHIETNGSPVHFRPRRLGPKKLQALKDEIKILLDQGIIKPSNSAWASPITLVEKKDGSFRVCGDYRALNAMTLQDSYPLPHLHDFSLNLRGKKIFSKIDLVKAYHQIPLDAESVDKTAVTTPIGLFAYTRMSFGLRNAAQSFQRFIDSILRDIDSCFGYIDDILVASETEDAHKADLLRVFKRLNDNGLVINVKKICFR